MMLTKELAMGVCPKCGAALDAPLEGAASGTATCLKCGALGEAKTENAVTETPPVKEAAPPPSQRVTVFFYDLLALCGVVAYLISPAAWPLLFVSAAMIAAAYIDGWKLKVPNWLTYRIMLSGWVLGAVYDAIGAPNPISPDSLESGSRLLASVAVTFFGFIIFVPIYAIGGVGAGDVKMQMGYGAWLGAFCGLYQGMSLIFYGYIVGIVVGGILALGMMLFLRQFGEYAKNTREILLDLATSGGNIGKVAEKAAQRKPRMTLLPYGIPLCIGYLLYMLYYYH